MHSEHWQRVEQIYQLAVEQPVGARAAFLASACGGDKDLLREVEALLAQEDAATVGTTAWIPAKLTTGRLEAGGQVGPYKLEAPIGAGGMGEVFRAVDTRLRRSVAIKFLLGAGASNPVHRRRFLQEARAASALNHPNIVVIYDIASQDGVDFLVMEHVAGQNLKDLIPAEGIPLEKVASIGSQIASALGAAHAAGITHRDIKPANIMVTPEGQVKVLDFGIAKMAPHAAAGSEEDTRTVADFTVPGVIMGTVAYMSPEQMRGDPVDGRADIFSMGCVLYQAATGRLPFRGASTLAMMHEIATATPAAPSSLRADLPSAFDRLIAGCLEKDPKQRPASANEVMEDLKRLASWREQATAREQAPAKVQTDRPSVAVIPFQLRSATKEDEFLSIALADAVIHRLVSTGKLLVRPIATVARYKGAETEWAQVARDLNVDLVVEGTIQKMGAKVRVIVQVQRAADVQTLHSSKHDGDVDDLFALQDRIADAVSDVFTPREQQNTQTMAPPTKDPLAYELYLRAIDRLAHWNKFDIGSGIEMLSQAVELDPGFAEAWGQLAEAYSQMGMFFDADPKWFEQGERAIAKTLELDPVQCGALQARAQILWSPSRKFQTRPALRALNASLRVKPGHHTARQMRGAIMFHLGFYEEARRDTAESVSINPKNMLPIASMAMIAQYEGDYATADHLIQRALALEPAFVNANCTASVNSLLLGRAEEARERVKRANQLAPGEPQLRAIEGLISAQEGDFRRAEDLADQACGEKTKSVTHTHHTWHYAAGAYALCGKPDKAIDQLRQCAALGLPNHRLFGRDPFLQPLRDRPEFTALLSELRRDHDQYRKEFDLSGGDTSGGAQA